MSPPRPIRVSRSRLSLRLRLMIVGVAGVAGALLLGGTVLYVVLGATVERTLDDNGRATAAATAQLVEQQRLPDPLPVSGAQLVQVLDARNRVVAASSNTDRLTALVGPTETQALRSGGTVSVPGSRAAMTGALRVVGVEAVGGGDPFTVVVAQSTAETRSSRAVLARLLLVGFPLLLAALAAIAWLVIGRTIRPVTALRQGAEQISGGAGREERLPVPPSADEIHALATTLNDMLDRLQNVRERQRAFVADAAHELRSPLASMRTQLEVAERLGEGGELPGDLLLDVARLTTLVEDLLLLARSDPVARPPDLQPVAVAPLLHELARRTTAEGLELAVAAGVEDRGLHVVADPDELHRALTNLVDNALRHAEGRVRLDATTDPAPGGRVRITVGDDGPGVAIADRERVFERFTRLDDARDRDAGGTGLGLAIVRELVSRAGGTVGLEDSTWWPVGVDAVVELPAADQVGSTCGVSPATLGSDH